MPGWPILPNLSENYLQCSLAELEEEEFDSLNLADMNETTHDGNWDKSCLSCLEAFGLQFIIYPNSLRGDIEYLSHFTLNESLHHE